MIHLSACHFHLRPFIQFLVRLQYENRDRYKRECFSSQQFFLWNVAWRETLHFCMFSKVHLRKW